MKIRNTVFIAIFTTALISVIGLLVFQQYKFNRGFDNYLNNARMERIEALKERLASWYSRNNSWQFIGEANAKTKVLHRRAKSIGLPRGTALFDSQNQLIAGRMHKPMSMLPIMANGQQVGAIGVVMADNGKAELDKRFIKQQFNTVVIASLLALFVALIAALILSNYLTKPIAHVTAVVNKLKHGRLNARSDYRNQNEIGKLSQDVNQLAKTLEQNRDSRQRWVADISHELRTPITIILGELECLQDGLTEFDDAAVTSLKEEVEGLNKLVNDLHQLTQADIGQLDLQLAPHTVQQLVSTAAAKFEPKFKQKNININYQLSCQQRSLVDEDRINQVLINLLENCYRYTPTDGVVKISCHQAQHSQELELVIENSGAPLADDELNKLFERLYRTDASRNKSSGGSGLGLAISKAIIEAHHGSMSAHHSTLPGLAISIKLPIHHGK
ncbi:ATP-binding protein [Paraferrimonas sp. SM1919]|uniref:ATP-binding protein n=1 Tax=Paraferrimonas sp. SM1919 TaxID=2662263 RepID=UPI0013D19F73|nr:ATP-binding protein [Paraferrimonas sp. SM1919]